MEFDVNSATRNQLLAKAHELGLDVSPSISKEGVKDLVAKQIGAKVVGDGAEIADAREVERNLADQKKQKRIRIRIHESPDHPPRIPVSVNGVQYTIKPGVPVDVPECVVEVLRNAVKTSFVSGEDERGMPQVQKRDGLQFPFEVLSS